MWFLLFLVGVMAYAAAKIVLYTRLRSAQEAGDVQREDRLARLAFQLRIAWIASVLVALLAALVVGLVNR